MTNTPANIKALQLKIWLSKPPAERLLQMMKDNEALMKFWSKNKEKEQQTNQLKNEVNPGSNNAE